MRPRLKLKASLALLLLLLVPGAAAQGLEAGPARVDLAFSEIPQCNVGLGDTVCLFSHEPGADPGLGDDRIDARRVVERATVAVDGGPAPVVIGLRPDGLVLDHSAFHEVNRTWVMLNDSLPGRVKEDVTLESRPFNMAGPDPPWGILVVVHLPAPVTNPLNGETYPFVSVQFSWECKAYFSDYNDWDEACTEDSLRPLPPGAMVGGDSDEDARRLLWMASCDYLARHFVPQSCAVLDAAQVVGGHGADLVMLATPSLAFGTGLEELNVVVEPSDGALFEFMRGAAPPGSWAGSEAPGRASPPAEAERLIGSVLEAAHLDPFTPPRNPSNSDRLSGFLPAGLPPAAYPLDAAPLVAVVTAALLLVAWVLFHRITPARVLEHPTRKRIYAAVVATPGIRIGSLSNVVGADYQTVRHHMAKLEHCGLVEGTREGQRRFFATAAKLSASGRNAAIVTGTPVSRALMHRLQLVGSEELISLRRHLGLPKSSASMALSRLEQAGLVRRERTGRKVLVRLTVSSGDPGPGASVP